MAQENSRTEAAQSNEYIDEVIDIEQYAKRGEPLPKGKAYRFKVNDKICVTTFSIITGQQILELAGLVPAENYRLRLKIAGGKPEPIGLNDEVDLRRPGLEKFRAIRKEQNEGEFQGRRDAPALEEDKQFLDSYGSPWEIVVDGSIWVLIHEFRLPEGYSETKVKLAIRIEGGYPLTPLDMMYVYPYLKRLDGKAIRQADVEQSIEGMPYQRWSRHRTQDNPWTPGEDSLETHIYLMEECFQAELQS